MTINRELVIELLQLNCEVLENALMCNYTSFRTGGIADLLLTPKDLQAFSATIRICKNAVIPITIIGNGSNLLVSDSGIRGVTIRTVGMDEMSYLGDGLISVSSGASLNKLCSFALSLGLTGLEFAYGIPGSVGGAAYMNAGAYDGEMKNVIYSCKHLDVNGNVGTFEKKQLDFGYRKSVYSENSNIVTNVIFKLKEGSRAEIESKMVDLMKRRKNKQPLEYPSAGSTFRRPEGYYAGALIEQCGLKGYSIGGAQVSEKHAGFIINKENASSTDVFTLINHVQEKVFDRKNIRLEPEVKFIGSFE